MSTVTVKAAPSIPADLGAVGIQFRDRDDKRAVWLGSDGYTVTRVIRATAWWPIRGGRPAIGKAAFVAATIARNFPGSTVTVRPLRGSRPLLTFTSAPQGAPRLTARAGS